MTIGGTRFCFAICLATGLLTVQAMAQGDPVKQFDPATAAVRRPGTTVRIDLIGDSTQTDHAGYGRGFCANLTDDVDCVNMAKGGASTRSFRAQGLWERSLETKPDYMLIQFGHNDFVFNRRPALTGTAAGGTGSNAAPFGGDRALTDPGDYEKNLRQYVTEARAAGIKPILVTPITRQYFEADGKIHSDQTEHCITMRKVAADMNVPLIELQNESIEYLESIGEEAGHKFEITKKDATGATIYDKTHFNWAGSYVFGRMVAVDLGKAVPDLKKYVRPEAAKLPPEGEKAMRVIEGGPVKIVLVGDSTVATGGGWGPGFCADFSPRVTCVDDALNGRSSKSFIDEGAWKKALDEHGDYYLIQFGHNDQKPNPALHTDPDTTFAANLHRYIADVRAIGAVPVLVTSLSRRNYKDGVLVEDLTAYADATRKVGADEYITVIDLNQMSVAMLKRMTQEQADKFDKGVDPDTGAAVAVPAGAPAPDSGGAAPLDRTHLNPNGQKVFGRMVADAIVRTQVELGPDLIGVPGGPTTVQPDGPPGSRPIPVPVQPAAPAPAAAPAASISPSAAAHGEIYPLPHATRIVLAGDSTVNHTTGWGTAFCERQATDTECFNSSRNGRSAKSYREQGLWDRALAVHPDYILIQFGANDGPGKGPLLEDVPATTFSEYMRDDIREARAMGAIPVLVTPLPQRNYKDGKHVRTLEDYAAAMRAVGKETGAVVLDLNAEANDALDAMTEAQAHQFNNNPADPSVPGRDTAHLNARGGEFFGAIVAREFAAAFPAVKVNTR
jgi:lysophospholipase L1-like esterase